MIENSPIYKKIYSQTCYSDSVKHMSSLRVLARRKRAKQA